MRKLGILVMALVLVVGMSAVGFAGPEGYSPDDLDTATDISRNDGDSVDVSIDVAEFAEVTLNSEQATLNFNDVNIHPKTRVGLTLKTNTDDTVIKVQENMSRHMAMALNQYNDDFGWWQARDMVWAYDEYSDDEFSNNWLVSPDAYLPQSGYRSGWYEDGNFQGVEYTSNDFERGVHNTELVIASQYRDDKGYDDWTSLPAGTIDGSTVTVTVLHVPNDQ